MRSTFMAKLIPEREDAMNAVIGRIERQVNAGRRVMDRTFHLVEKQVGPAMSTRRAQIAAGVMIGAIVVLSIGMIAYRRHRRPTLASRIRRVLPEELRLHSIKRSLG
jgi:hypothetical protein